MLSLTASLALKPPPSSSCGTDGEEVWGDPMLSPTTLLTGSSSCDTGGEEVWEVQSLPGPTVEPDYFTPAEASTFFFLWHRWGRSVGGASTARAQR